MYEFWKGEEGKKGVSVLKQGKRKENARPLSLSSLLTSGATAASVHAHGEAADPDGRALSLGRGLGLRRRRRMVRGGRRRIRLLLLLLILRRRVALLLLLRWRSVMKKKNRRFRVSRKRGA